MLQTASTLLQTNPSIPVLLVTYMSFHSLTGVFPPWPDRPVPPTLCTVCLASGSSGRWMCCLQEPAPVRFMIDSHLDSRSPQLVSFSVHRGTTGTEESHHLLQATSNRHEEDLVQANGSISWVPVHIQRGHGWVRHSQVLHSSQRP